MSPVSHSPNREVNTTKKRNLNSPEEVDNCEFKNRNTSKKPKMEKCNIETALCEIFKRLDKLDHFDRRMDNMDEKLAKLDLLDGLTQSVTQNTNDIENLVHEVQHLKRESARLTEHISRLNLIYHGVSDSQNETNPELKSKLSELVSDVSEIDLAWRLGKFDKNKIRPVKVCFKNMSSRETEFKNRKQLGQQFHVSADLPKATRDANATLRKLKINAENEGKKASINWKAQKITIDNVTYDINNMAKSSDMDTVSKFTKNSAQSFKKRAMSDPNSSFLGIRGNLNLVC